MIVVTGVGRSGTTFTAGLLQSLGVDMGGEGDPNVEDPELRQMLADAFNRGWEEGVVEARLLDYVARREERARGRAWGVKEPRLTDFQAAASNVLLATGAELVLCLRDPGQVLDSWVRVTSSTRAQAAERLRHRARALIAFGLQGRVTATIDFTARRTEAEVRSELLRLPTAKAAQAAMAEG